MSAPATALPTANELAALAANAQELTTHIGQVLSGKESVIRTTISVLLARGHLLLEDVPGVGKTTLATALAHALGLSVSRIQFTPDMLPSDLTGVSIYQRQTSQFEFRPGPLFSQIVIGDEVNRASPKTQAALLECMQEGQVTVDGKSYELPHPFFVIATQNPVEMEGTYPLPEAQRDRFTARIEMGYPTPADELAMLDMHNNAASQSAELSAVLQAADIEKMAQTAAAVFTAPLLKQYVIDLITATRSHPDLRLGASPRAAIQLLAMAKVTAAMNGRDHALPEDVQQLLIPVLAHRVLARSASATSDLPAQILSEILDTVPVRIHTAHVKPDSAR